MGVKFCPLIATLVHVPLHPAGLYEIPLLLVEMVRDWLGVLLLALAESDTRPGALTVIVHVLVPLEYPKS